MKKIKILILSSILVSLISLVSVRAFDEAEMQNMMTGEVVSDASSIINNFGILLWIRELLIIVVLILLVVFLIKQISKKEKNKK